MTDKLSYLRDAHVAEVAGRLGLTVRGRCAGPCVACGAESRGGKDRRLPLLLRPDGKGWRCMACGEGGDGVTLTAYRVTGQRRPASWAPVMDAVDRMGMGVAVDGVAVWRAPRSWWEPLPPRDVWRDVEGEAQTWREVVGLDPETALTVALAERAYEAGWTGDEVMDRAREYAAGRLACAR